MDSSKLAFCGHLYICATSSEVIHAVKQQVAASGDYRCVIHECGTSVQPFRMSPCVQVTIMAEDRAHYIDIVENRLLQWLFQYCAVQEIISVVGTSVKTYKFNDDR